MAGPVDYAEKMKMKTGGGMVMNPRKVVCSWFFGWLVWELILHNSISSSKKKINLLTPFLILFLLFKVFLLVF